MNTKSHLPFKNGDLVLTKRKGIGTVRKVHDYPECYYVELSELQGSIWTEGMIKIDSLLPMLTLEKTMDQIFPKDGIIQLHWQNNKNNDETILVAQGGQFESPQKMNDWIYNMVKEHIDKCPKNWKPLVCDQTSKHFLLTEN